MPAFTQWRSLMLGDQRIEARFPTRFFLPQLSTGIVTLSHRKYMSHDIFQHNDLYNNFILFMHIKFHRLKICNHSYFIQFVCFSLISSWFFFLYLIPCSILYFENISTKKKTSSDTCTLYNSSKKNNCSDPKNESKN